MAQIATLEEFASALQTNVDTATAHLLLLDLAQGLIAEVIGEQDPWPVTAKAVALAAAARAYVNPEGVRQETTGSTTVIYNAPLYANGVYLSDAEIGRLQTWLNRGSSGRVGTIRLGSGYPSLGCERPRRR